MRRVIPSLLTLFQGRAAVQPLCAMTAQLPDDTRRVVTLYKVYDFSVPDIAARLQLSERAVEQHLVTAALVFSGCIDLSELNDGADSTPPLPGAL